MGVTEVHEALGSFEFELLGNVPRDVLDAVTYFGHVAIIPGRIDALQYGDGCLDAARYVGVVRKKKIADDGRTNMVQDDIRISGVGMNFWLGDEDGKGDVLEAEKNFVSASFSNVMSPMASGGLVPPSCSMGTIGTVTGSYTGKHQYQVPRQAIKYVCETLSDNSGPPGTGNGTLTFRVSNTGAFSAGRETDMVVTTPTCIIMRKGGTQGEDMTVRALPSTVDMDQDMEDFSTRVVMIAESDGESLATGAADIDTISPGTNVYKDLLGGNLKLTRLVSESETEEQWADTRAELALRKVIETHRELTLSTDDYDIHGSFKVGDYVWVYEPDAGLVDNANEVYIRGVRINPIKLQITEMNWPVTEGYTIAYRDANGVWYDLSDYVRYEEDQASQIVAGNFARSLDAPGESIALRMGTLVTADATTPNAPAFTTPFTTSSYEDNTGNLKAQVTVVWTTPTNTDSSAITDGHFYELHFKRAVETVWSTRTIGWGINSSVLENLLPATSYNYRIRAVDINGHQSTWSATHTATTGSTPSIPNPVTISSVTSDSSEDVSGVLKAFAQVNWSQPTNTDSSAIVDGQSYEVQYKLNSASVWSSVMVAWGTTATQIHDLNPGVQYNFKVRAIDNAGNAGAFGTTSNHTTNSTPSTPAAPAQPTVTSDSSEDLQGVLKAFALVSWSQPLNTDSSAIIDGAYYEVQYKLSAATNWSSQTVPFGTTSTNISNLNPGASADFKVRAVDNSGRVGAFSTTRVHALSSTPSTPAAPSTTPSGYATASYEVGSQTRARILATWTTPLNTDSSTIIDGAYYELQFKIDGQSNWETRTVSWGTNELLLQDLAPNVVYRFRIRAADTSGRLSAFSAEGTRTTGNTPTVPNAPTWVTPFTGAVYLDTNGLSKASARLEWNTPTNSDSSAITDGDRYEVNVRKSGETEWVVYNVPWGTNTLRLLELSVGTGYEARIRAWDRGGNSSAFSTTQAFTTLEDTIAPSTPAAPTVATSMVGVQITHSLGVSTGGTFNLEADLAYLEVHKGSSSGFTVSDSTRIGTIQANAGTMQAATPVVKTFPIGDTTQQWYKVRAVDMSGNVSSASTAASSTATLIDTAHISDLTVSKVTAGTISSNWLIGANIGTASSGARVELNSTGFQAFDSAGVNTVNITNSGTFAMESPPSVATTPAISHVGYSAPWSSTTTGTDVTLYRPDGVQVGDLMIANLTTSATASPTTTITGWTVVQTIRADTTTDTNLVILKRTYAEDDPFQWDGTTTSCSHRHSQVVAYSGADDAAQQFIGAASATSAVTAKSIQTSGTNTNASAWRYQVATAIDSVTGGTWTSDEVSERVESTSGSSGVFISQAVYDSAAGVSATAHTKTATFLPSDGAFTVQRADTFDRANSALTLGTSSSGHAWTNQTGVLGISSNQAYAPTATQTNIATTTASVADGSVAVTVAAQASGGDLALVFRFSTTSNYWRWRRTTGNVMQLQKVVAGVSSDVGSSTADVVAGDRLTVLLSGNSISLYVNETLRSTHNDSFNATQTIHGLATFNPSASTRFDDFEVLGSASGGWTSAAAWQAYIKPLPASLARMEMDHQGLRTYNSVDVKTLDLQAATGAIDMLGNVSSFNYVEGQSGWHISGDGGAQFESLGVVKSLGATSGSFSELFLDGIEVPHKEWYDVRFPAVTVSRATSLTLSNVPMSGNTNFTLIPFDVQYHERNTDAGGMHSTSTNPSRLIAPVRGIYQLSWVLASAWTASSPTFTTGTTTNSHHLDIRKNAAGTATGGSAIVKTACAIPNGTGQWAAHNGTVDLAMEAGDYVEFISHTNVSNAGGTRELVVGASGNAQVSLRWVSSLDGPGTGGGNIYQSDFVITGCKSYIANNTPRPISPTEWAYQGYYSSNYGNQKSVLTFDYAGIQAALAGKTLLSCNFRFHVYHSYFGEMTVKVGTHTSASLPTNWPPTGLLAGRVRMEDAATSVTYNKSLGLTIGNEFKNGTAKGLTIGPGSSETVDGYYGYLWGNQTSSPSKMPMLRFVYTD